MRDNKVSIYLWRGKDRAYLKKYADCADLFKETRFRLEKNSLREKRKEFINPLAEG